MTRKTYYTCFLILLMPIYVYASDSIKTAGFWTRYSPSKEYISADSGFAARLMKKERCPVQFIYDVDFATYFDNREYHAPYQIPQTILNFRLSPQIGVRIMDRAYGKHEFVAGVSYTQRLGGNWRDIQFNPIAYYHFNYRGFDAGMGAIPYSRRIVPVPEWLMYDSLTYYHPNIQGALLQYHNENGFLEFMCDWRGAQTADRREMFRLLLNGLYQKRWLQVGGLAHMNHKAGFATTYEPVMDDVHLNAFAGADVTKYVPLDSLSLRIGYIFGWQRDRGANDVFANHGLIIELYANWWFIGIKNTFYYGDNLQPLRVRNENSSLGDPFYQSRLYNRTDLFVYLYRSSFLDFYFSWNMHYDSISLQHQQQMSVRFHLEPLMRELAGHQQPHLRGLFDK